MHVPVFLVIEPLSVMQASISRAMLSCRGVGVLSNTQAIEAGLIATTGLMEDEPSVRGGALERVRVSLTRLPCRQLEAHKKEQAAREHEREKREAERKGHKGGASASGNGASGSGSGSGGSGSNFRGTASSEAGIQAAASDPSKGSSSARS